MGAVTTSSPSYTSGQTDPLSLTSAGALRVDATATTQPISGSVSISGTPSVSISGNPVLGAGSNTVGKADMLGNSGAALDSAAGTSNAQAITIQGNASGVPVPVTGTFSATIGGFTPTPAYSVKTATTTSTAYPLPTGTVAIFYNTGSNAITVKLGSSSVSVTCDQADVIQPNSWMAFTVGTATYYAAIVSGGTSTIVVSGGAGMPTGAGGGSGPDWIGRLAERQRRHGAGRQRRNGHSRDGHILAGDAAGIACVPAGARGRVSDNRQRRSDGGDRRLLKDHRRDEHGGCESRLDRSRRD